MNLSGLCRPYEHHVTRRSMLCGLLGGAAGAIGLRGPAERALAAEIRSQGKQLLVLNHVGGLSQLESWDPKPGTRYAGPCQQIQTTVPGIQISEWMPYTAQQMQHLLVVRSLSTGENNHGPAQTLMFSGRREGAGLPYPWLECVAGKRLTPPRHPVPGFVSVGHGASPAFLGPQFGPVRVEPGKPPSHLDRPQYVSEDAEFRRRDLRKLLDGRFAARRGTAQTSAYAETFEQAARLMQNKRLFNLDEEPAADVERYGRHEFGQKCLLARRLLESGVTCVSVGHNGYDTHAENFNVHLDLLEQFDRPFACLVEDLAARGRLANTLVVVMGEFGRTPNINQRFGRDHWSGSWSAAFAGLRIPGGGVYGATGVDGSEVVDKKVEAPVLFHTLCGALGIDSTDSWTVEGQQVPIGDPAFGPLNDMLA